MSTALADPTALVAALCEVAGVAAAGIEPDPDGDSRDDGCAAEWPGLLRLDLTPGVDEAAVAMAAGRLLRERFGLGIDSAAVAILEESVGVGSGVRRVQVVRAGRRATATATLDRAGRTATGEAAGPASSRGIRTAVAEATLAAAAACDPASAADLDALDSTDEAGGPSVRVALRRTAPMGLEPVRVVGTAAVRQDLRQAAVRAVIAALAQPSTAGLGSLL